MSEPRNRKKNEDEPQLTLQQKWEQDARHGVTIVPPRKKPKK